MIGLIIHKNPPFHYFVPILLFPTLLLAVWLVRFWQQSQLLGKVLSLTTFGLVIIANSLYIFSSQYLWTAPPSPSYSQLHAVARMITNSVPDGDSFTLIRIGPFDTYHEEFKESYLYVLEWLGRPATQDHASSDFTIVVVEDASRQHEVTLRFPQAFQVGQEGSTTVWLARAP
jgi:hypothetical protein